MRFRRREEHCLEIAVLTCFDSEFVSGRRLSFLAPVPTGGEDVDEISQNTGGMERIGNFWLTYDIKEE